MTCHRAEPLDLVEARAMAARVAWPTYCDGFYTGTTPDLICPVCNTGTVDYCDCAPLVVQDRLPEDFDNDREAMSGGAVAVLIVLFITSCAFAAWAYCVFGAQLKPLLVAALEMVS